MIPSADSLQLLLIDGLFICLAGAIGLWFRSWIRGQQRALDRRLAALESQEESLERLGSRLLVACRNLEGLYAKHAPGEAGRAAATGGGRARGRGPQEERQHIRATGGPIGAKAETDAPDSGREGVRGTGFARARDLLEQGLPAKEVARRLGMGMAEVGALKRMMDFDPRSTRPRDG